MRTRKYEYRIHGKDGSFPPDLNEEKINVTLAFLRGLWPKSKYHLQRRPVGEWKDYGI